MDSPWLSTVAKIIGILLMLVNLAFHGLAALFIGGPLGLGLYLVGFVAFWTTGWITLRRWHEASAKE